MDEQEIWMANARRVDAARRTRRARLVGLALMVAAVAAYFIAPVVAGIIADPFAGNPY